MDFRTGSDDPFAWVGQTIDGKYHVDRVIGEGGFGVVYHATHASWQEPVAVKCFKLGSTARGPVRDRFEETFRAEGKVLYRLRDTPGIVRALDTGAVESPNGQWCPYLVLEWLEGRTLAADLAQRRSMSIGGRSLREAIDLLDPAARGIAVAHAARISHRDLKPENLFLAQARGITTLKVLDFGIAKVMTDAATLTVASTATGFAPRAFSAAYAAPEQFEPVLGATGPWTDVYALALVFIEVVTGRSPYVGDSKEQWRSEAIDAERRPSFARSSMEVPPEVERAMQRALAVDPRNRFETAQAFWSALTDAIAGSPTAIVSPSTEPSVLAEQGLPLATSRTRSAPDKRTERRRYGPWALVGAASLLSTGVVGAYYGLEARHQQRAASQLPVPPPASMPQSFTEATPAKMIAVPAGSFAIGSDDEEDDERPKHVVSLAAFEIDATEVSVASYKTCVAARVCGEAQSGAGCNWGVAERVDHPMNCVTWTDADRYCRGLGKRLPTEVEWEYAARGGKSNKFPWGDALPNAQLCWNGEGNPAGKGKRSGTCISGAYDADRSPFGVVDMGGNVAEWTSSPYCSYADPGCAARERVVRGASWNTGPVTEVRASYRDRASDFERTVEVGFRCVRTSGPR